ncbi:MAG: DUF6691 family protein [Cellulosilyticaceae bacterium]
MNEILLAVGLGALFGFVLHRIGATDGDYLIGMLRLRNTHLMKTILFGIGVATVLTFISFGLNILEVSHFSIKALNMGVIIGGAIFGIGWALAGYCPGTGVTAIGAGKKDAIFYILGGLVGALIYSKTYTFFADMGWFEEILAGQQTLVTLRPDVLGFFESSFVGIVFGLLLMGIPFVLPKKFIK